MQSLIVIACLGLLLSVEPASAQNAQKEYSLKVSIHSDVQSDPQFDWLTKEGIEGVFDVATRLVLAACNVKLKLDSLDTFGSDSAPSIISDRYHLEAVHGVGTPPHR